VEAELQELLAANPALVGEGLSLIRREHPTDIGPVDLLCCDTDGQYVIVEIKRRGELDSVEQLSRYLECMQRESKWHGVRGVLAAQIVKPQARVLAESRGIAWCEIDYDALRGLGSAGLTLF
jgi:RecB family endonuclease NucS